MNLKEAAPYQVSEEPFWSMVRLSGGDGYDVMDAAEARDWRAIGSWGHDGYDLGSWPYVVVYHRDRADRFELVLYVEGDIDSYQFPSAKLREEVTDDIALFYWKQSSRMIALLHLESVESVEQLPPELRGPVRYWKEQ